MPSLVWRAGQQLPGTEVPSAEAAAGSAAGSRLRHWLTLFAAAVAPRPAVLVLDEADVVRGPPLISLLRQLRNGFTGRGVGRFPTSVALVGMRDLRDYLKHAKDGVPVNPGSPFNVKAASVTLRDFTAAEVGDLCAQHTAETGQDFEPGAVERAFWWTQGQPWLVNALARTAVLELVPDRGLPVTAAHIDEAKEQLVLARTTHLDSLAERLREPRVARVVEPIILGDRPFSVPYEHDDFQYALDLGLIRRGPQGAEPANPLYREVLVRQVGLRFQEALHQPWWPWRTAKGRLDFPALVEAFLDWWRDNEGALEAHGEKGYPEAVPHLALMAFLQRVVNGGGSVLREYASGRGAVDLVVQYGGDRFVVEIKRVFSGGRSPERVREEGVAQLGRYLEELGEPEGWLVIFDQRPGLDWERRLWREEREHRGRILRLRGA
ncbi:MAG: ATP-binding protein [Pseudomonadota bacterium]